MLSSEDKGRVEALTKQVAERVSPLKILEKEDLSIPEGMQDDPNFIAGLLRKVDSQADTIVSIIGMLKEYRVTYVDFLEETKQLYKEELEQKMLEFLEAATSAGKRISKEQSELKARVETKETKASLEFAEANDKVFKDALDALDFKLKHLSNKRKSLLGIVGTIRSSSIFQPNIHGPQAFAPRGPKDF